MTWQLLSELSLPPELAHVLTELPKHMAHASDVGCDLSGMRLNVLRLVCGLSTPQSLLGAHTIPACPRYPLPSPHGPLGTVCPSPH